MSDENLGPTRAEDMERRAVDRFTRWMRLKLRMHAEKGHWSLCSQEYLMKRLREEVEELQEALDRNDLRGTCEEAADVSNFAMMLSDNAETLRRGYRLDDGSTETAS